MEPTRPRSRLPVAAASVAIVAAIAGCIPLVIRRYADLAEPAQQALGRIAAGLLALALLAALVWFGYYVRQGMKDAAP